jgi:ubiquinone/menaquinone biosynthesis C-methylase UbiE/CheY-like chemotaxis protein
MIHQNSDRPETQEPREVMIAGFAPHQVALLRSAFEGRFVIHSATDGADAIKLLRDIPFVSVLLVQQDMRPMTGVDFLRIAHDLFGGLEQTVKVLATGPDGQENLGGPPAPGSIDAFIRGEFRASAVLLEINRLLSRRSREKRASMRISLPPKNAIVVEIGLEGKAELEDIGESGLFLKSRFPYPMGKTLPLILNMPGAVAHLVLGSVARRDEARPGLGIRFQTVGKGARDAIFDFLRDHSSLQNLDELKERYPFLKTDDMIAFQNEDRIASSLMTALRSQMEIIAISPQTRASMTLRFSDLKPGKTCVLEGKDLDIKFKTSDSVFISFQAGYATYNFETKVRRIQRDGNAMECFFPKIMFYSEKRAIKRKGNEGNLRLEIHLPAPFQKRIHGRITDISEGGASFIAESDGIALLAGTPLESIKIFDGNDLVRDEIGEIRNVVGLNGAASGPIRYGVQFGIGRLNIQSARPLEPDPASIQDGTTEKTRRPRMRRAADLSLMVHGSPDVIRLETHKGEEIVGLLNSSFPLDDLPIPVIVIPPAFGKTKETLFGMALTLIEDFRHLGKPLAVIRYDGIRRKGESYRDSEAAEPPYEMINASVSQGSDDIKAVLDWIALNSRGLKASQIILVSFSLSALEARLTLRDEHYRRQVSAWIACMGTLEFRDLMTRINCGLDLLEQHQLGIDLGLVPILGNLIRMKHYAGDVVANGVATLDQAREDMRQIGIPITWIYGEHDHWVNAEFVRDVMSIHAGAPRDVIPVPIGHNARTSEEALHLFGIISGRIHRYLYGEMIRSQVPSRADLETMRRAEQDRLPPINLKNRKDYWQRYLVGQKDLLGFDVMALSDDYQQLMEDQLIALDLQPGDRLLDLGGGTGNFVNHMMDENRPLPGHITIADLIPEGLKQAREKLTSRILSLDQPPHLGLVGLDMELNRFIPIRRFLEGETGRFRDLTERIENISLESAAKIDDGFSPRLHRILRGEPISAGLDHWLRKRFDLPEYKIIVDFNHASRYIRGLISEEPPFRKIAFPGGLGTAFHLPFKPGTYNKILMSLVLSYIYNPVETLREIRRIIRPDGILVLSSMRPDTDASGPFTRLVAKIEKMPAESLPSAWTKSRLLDSIRSFLNDAQALVDLEEAGTFDFFDPDKLNELLEEAGWEPVRSLPSFGEPPQGYIVAAKLRISDAKS